MSQFVENDALPMVVIGTTKGDLIRGGVVTLLKTPPHDIPDYGVQYLEQLLTTLVE